MGKKRLLDLIWTDFVQIYTNINYSSLYCEKLREKQNDIYFWAIYACFAIPPILSLVAKRYQINNDFFFFGLIVVILVMPLAVRVKNKHLIYSWFGIYEKKVDDLLKLNEDLDRYKDALLSLFFQVEGMSDHSSKWSEVLLRYDKLKSDSVRYTTEHDRLTGKIDPVIQENAQKKTSTMIKRSNYYGRENTTER